MKEPKLERYQRIYQQLADLFIKTKDPVSRMATMVAVLHHKLDNYYWTGFYRLIDEELVVGPYQGFLACLLLKQHTGVCWAAVDRKESVIVGDVNQFPGHIACDSRSRSEITVPVFDAEGRVRAVLDVDSSEYDSFDEKDAQGLEKIVSLIYQKASNV